MTMINLYDDVAKKLNERRGSWPEFAQAANVSYSWICKISSKRIPNPGYNTLLKLQTVLENGKAS